MVYTLSSSVTDLVQPCGQPCQTNGWGGRALSVWKSPLAEVMPLPRPPLPLLLVLLHLQTLLRLVALAIL
eukprot:8310110-Pyramimonas_sp.AAC.1